MSSRKGKVATVQHIFEVMVEQPKNGFDRIRLEVSYDKGGWGGQPRGYSIMAFPAKVEEEGVTTIALFGGASKFLEGATRFSYDRLFKVCDLVRDGNRDDEVNIVLSKVMQRNDMTIVGKRIYLYRPST